MSDKIIFPESIMAARFYCASGERAARWGGATHVHCDICGAPTSKNRTVCETCRAQQALDRYLKLPIVRWCEDVLVYSPVTDKYYQDREEVRDDNSEGIFDPIPLQLVLCKPIYATGIDPEAYYEDLLPEYNDLSDISQDLVDIFQELNDELAETKIILSYEPTDMAII